MITDVPTGPDVGERLLIVGNWLMVALVDTVWMPPRPSFTVKLTVKVPGAR